MYPTQQGVLKPDQWQKFEKDEKDTKDTLKKDQTINNNDNNSNKTGPNPLQQQARENEIYKEAYQKGYQQGQINTYNEYKQTQKNKDNKEKENLIHLQSQNDLLNSFIKNINHKSINIVSSLQNEYINIIEKITYEILKAELSLHPEKLQTAIDDALSLFIHTENISLYLHPDSYSKISTLFSHSDINIFADASLAPEDFYLTQGHSKLDGQLETRIQHTISSLFNYS